MDSAQRIIEERFDANGNRKTPIIYQLHELIGVGGFGKVFSCTRLDNGKSYAVKVLTKAKYVSPRAIQSLHSEISIQRSLRHHSRICSFRHYFQCEQYHYIVLELCENKCLHQFLAIRNQQLSLPEVLYFMTQLVESVQHMHDNNIMHRDIKPENLFLDKDLNVKLGDFGLASRLKSPDDTSRHFCGTLQYMAPEVLEKRPYSFPADVFSMGIVLFRLLTGKHPFYSREQPEDEFTRLSIINGDYEFPSSNHVPVSECAKDLISSMLDLDPSARPSLDEVLGHAFFSSGGGTLPKMLPLTALDTMPTWEVTECGTLMAIDLSNNETPPPTNRHRIIQSESSHHYLEEDEEDEEEKMHEKSPFVEEGKIESPRQQHVRKETLPTVPIHYNDELENDNRSSNEVAFCDEEEQIMAIFQNEFV
eukprot:scaffold2782_cov46-Attheya_sp.AAC.2